MTRLPFDGVHGLSRSKTGTVRIPKPFLLTRHGSEYLASFGCSFLTSNDNLGKQQCHSPQSKVVDDVIQKDCFSDNSGQNKDGSRQDNSTPGLVQLTSVLQEGDVEEEEAKEDSKEISRWD